MTVVLEIYKDCKQDSKMRLNLNYAIMKRIAKISGIAIVIMATVTVSLLAQGRMMGMQDTSRFRRMQHMQMRGGFPGGDSLRMNMMRRHGDSLFRGGMRRGRGFGNMGPGMMPNMRGHMGYGQMPGFRGNMWRSPSYGMRRGSGMGPGYGMRRGMGPWRQDMRPAIPGLRIIESLPNLTDKQKTDIEKLRQTQMEEMKKFREDMQTKMNALRKSNRDKIVNLLTPEQKKYFEEHFPAAAEKK